MGKLRPPKPAGAGKIAAPSNDKPDLATLRVVFGFRHIAEGYALGGCDAPDAAAFIDALRTRSNLSWAQIMQAPRQKLGCEKISASLRVNTPDTVPADRRDEMLSFRFGGDKQRFIGYRDGVTFEIVWIDHEGGCYKHD